jgi:hypothetical protein
MRSADVRAEDFIALRDNIPVFGRTRSYGQARFRKVWKKKTQPCAPIALVNGYAGSNPNRDCLFSLRCDAVEIAFLQDFATLFPKLSLVLPNPPKAEKTPSGFQCDLPFSF